MSAIWFADHTRCVGAPQWATAAVLALLTWPPTAPIAEAQPLVSSLWEPDGAVVAQVQSGNTLYIGGGFSSVGPHTGSWVSLDATTQSLTGFPDVDGHATSAVPDGAGGWFLGGEFRGVGSFARQNLAHIRADGTVSPWNPAANGEVLAMAALNGTVYVGGNFTNLGGVARNCLGAVDAGTGRVVAWNPQPMGSQGPGGEVFALAATVSAVYAGGYFRSIGGQPRDFIAALDPATGAATAWNPTSDGYVYALTVEGSTVYAGGLFRQMGGANRRSIAALDVATGSATDWNPGVDGRVFVITVSASTVYFGGHFSTAGGLARSSAAAVDAGTGALLPWDPAPDLTVRALAVQGSNVYMGGVFTRIGGEARRYFAVVDAVNGRPNDWDPRPSWAVTFIGSSGSTVHVGGEFSSWGVVPRFHLAAIDLSTGAATDWNPGMDRTVVALAVNASTVYAGGHFGTGPFLQAFNRKTGSVVPIDGRTDDFVWALAATDSLVYAGGDFLTAGGLPRDRLAAFDVSTGALTDWDPGAHGQVRALLLSGDTLYVGGGFSTLGGQSRARIGAVDVRTGAALPWNPSCDGGVQALALQATTLFAGGSFTEIAHVPRRRLAALDVTTAAALPFNPGVDGYVFALAARGPKVYAGGDFLAVAGRSRYHIAALDAVSGELTPWDPGTLSGAPNSGYGWVNALTAGDSLVYAGGGFQTAAGRGRLGLAAIVDTDRPVEILDLSAQAHGAHVTLTWQAVNDWQVNAFRIYRARAGGLAATLVPDVPRHASGVYAFQDSVPHPGRYSYEIAGIRDGVVVARYAGVEVEVLAGPPASTRLLPAAPNPFNPNTTLRYEIASEGVVALEIFDTRGRCVRRLVPPGSIPPGRYAAVWDGRDDREDRVASGVYRARLSAEGRSWTHAITLLK